MAITLVMMAAVVNLFANISTGVNNRQGAMEVSAELRVARARLYSDLAGATVRSDETDSPNGYFEIVEGVASDENPRTANSVTLDPAISLIPSSNTVADAEGNLINSAIVTDAGGLGDYDDILAMTVESKGAPFRGRGRALIPGMNPVYPYSWIDKTIESQFAEVIWFAVENPADGSQGEPGMRTIYRRVLLIAPWVSTYDIPGGLAGQSDPIFNLSNSNFFQNISPFYPNPSSGNAFDYQLRAMLNFQNQYDISVRLDSNNGRIVPNTLADLARRENRFAHLPDNFISGTVRKFPHQFSYNIATRDPSISLPAGTMNTTVTPAVPLSSLQPLSGDRAGGDIILTNALAFDVQVFDPGAPLYNYLGSEIRPNRSVAFQNAVAAGPNAPNSFITGFGAYTDLGWNDPNGTNYPSGTSAYNYASIPSAPVPLFQQERMLGWHPTFPNALTRMSSLGFGDHSSLHL